MPETKRAATSTRIHAFDSGVDNAALLGGKGASLARMTGLGLPTPPGFTITTDGWRAFHAEGGMPDAIRDELAERIAGLERTLDRRFGGDERPLLVSVRSGAPISMPGMMDTVLNLGLNERSVAGLAAATGDEAFAWTVHLRFLRMFASVVRGVPEAELADVDAGLTGADAVAALQAAIAERSGGPVPDDAVEQLHEAVMAVWRSWDGRRARRYRKFARIPDDLGTAVTVQAMVFGNQDDRSGTGVVFTRDPTTGTPEAYGDYLPRAQGEDIVAGGHDTLPLDTMRATLPGAYDDLVEALALIEAEYRDMCDVEFTVEGGKLWILQARPGQRGGAAALRIAVDLVDEGLVSVEEALDRIPASAMERLQAPVFARGQALDVIGSGTPASAGAACGRAVFDADRAQELAADGAPVILVRPETSPEDIAGMIACSGIVTAVGGRTSHAAVVARGIGRPAICGVDALVVDPAARRARFGDREIVEGDVIALDGGTGEVVAGEVELVPALPDARVARVLQWADERRPVELLTAVPDGATVVTGPDDVPDDVDGPVLLELEWEGEQTTTLLERTVTALRREGDPPLLLRLPDVIGDGDLRLPAARWTAFVVTDPEGWPARLLAGRVRRPDA
ncbi:MAG: pyruvate, phosphate dikinase [Solirubrobacteraceae bacterium]|nr:pyruvate, phosphate dikinase [Solirubrobacteraceae bacterium]